MTAIPGTRGIHLNDPTGIELARKLFVRKRWFDLADARSIFRHLGPANDERFPFDSGFLDRTSRMNHALVFVPEGLTLRSILSLIENRTSAGTPLFNEHDLVARQDQQFFTKDHLPGGWWSVSPLISDSVNSNLLEQTSCLDVHVEKVFGSNPPEHVVQARREFEQREWQIQSHIQTARRRALGELLDLQINTLFRAPPALILWLLALCEGINQGERLLSNVWSWTGARALIGKQSRVEGDTWPVAIGNFGQDGVQTAVFDPWEGRTGLGTCFAYRATVSETLNLVA